MKTYIISDCHGNIEGLMRALEKHKLFDKHGNRQLKRSDKIFIIGDAANCVKDSWIGDMAILDMVGNTIDGMVIGNHELPYLTPGNSFSGFYHYPEIQHRISMLMNEDLIGAAILVGNILISHAGLSKHYATGHKTSEQFFNAIEDHWKARNFNHSWFSSVGYSRGGRQKVGGIFWCDFDNEFIPTDFPQIVGHTPRGVRMKGNALCIDVGAKNIDTEPFILEIA